MAIAFSSRHLHLGLQHRVADLFFVYVISTFFDIYVTANNFVVRAFGFDICKLISIIKPKTSWLRPAFTSETA